jgi:hypothetical protein
MKRIVAAVAVVLSLAIAGSASAASKQLWHLTALDQAASEIAGFPVAVNASDSIPEWAALTGDPERVAGFTYLTTNPNFALFNPYDGYYYKAYHAVFLSPSIYATFHSDLALVNPYDAAEALLALDHESQHQRLYSGDESRVNACALADMPRFTAKFIAPTVVQDVQVPESYRAKVRYRKKVNGRWVGRTRYVTKVRYVTQQQTVANPAYTAVLAAAQQIYISQPPPYNAGTCW